MYSAEHAEIVERFSAYSACSALPVRHRTGLRLYDSRNAFAQPDGVAGRVTARVVVEIRVDRRAPSMALGEPLGPRLERRVVVAAGVFLRAVESHVHERTDREHP